MDSHITNQLAPDEKIVWSGKPHPFSAKSGGYSKSLSTRAIICAIAAAVLSAAYVLAAKASSVKAGAVGIIICILVPAYIALTPVFDARRIQKKSSYAVSNKRLFVMPDEKRLFTMDLDEISTIQYVGAEGNCGHVVVSKDPSLSTAGLNLRKMALSPVLPDGSSAGATQAEAKTVVLYNLQNPEEAMGYLHTAD